MEVISPEFKDEQEKNTVTLVAILTILVGLIAPLVVFFALKDSLSPAASAVNKALLNFELFLLILALIASIPIVGWLAAILIVPFVTIAHFIVTIAATVQIMNGSTVKIWVPIKFIK